jgi:hypothetical protein
MNEELAEMMEWQARCGDLQTVNEQLREERDVARKSWEQAQATNALYWERILDLEKALNLATAKITHLQQGVEL